MKTSLIMTSLLFTSLAQSATAIDGLYMSMFGGYAYVPEHISNTTAGVLRDATDYDRGYHAGGRLGYQSHPLRYEAEYTFIHAQPRQFNVNNRRQTGVSGFTTAHLIMANIYYDLPALIPKFNPFLGVGLGYGYLQEKLQSRGPFGPTIFSANDDVFAYQATTGLTFNFSESYAGNLAYRYVGSDRADEYGKVFQAHLATASFIMRFDTPSYK